MPIPLIYTWAVIGYVVVGTGVGRVIFKIFKGRGPLKPNTVKCSVPCDFDNEVKIKRSPRSGDWSYKPCPEIDKHYTIEKPLFDHPGQVWGFIFLWPIILGVILLVGFVIMLGKLTSGLSKGIEKAITA